MAYYKIRGKAGYIVNTYNLNGAFTGHLKNKKGKLRIFSTRSSARKAIWRERNGKFIDTGD